MITGVLLVMIGLVVVVKTWLLLVVVVMMGLVVVIKAAWLLPLLSRDWIGMTPVDDDQRK